MSAYKRYRIKSEPAPNLDGHPSRFKVEVNRLKLAQLLLHELVEHRGNMPVVLSRPCVYGVFSGPVGGFMPREQHCVGCLRCTVEHPDVVTIRPNPQRLRLGDSQVSPDQVDTILYEAATGRVPVKGAGYRGAFGGEGWDSMWTDMSEIVRPTRDGIHGREFISTSVDLGRKPVALALDESAHPVGEKPKMVTLPIPFLFQVNGPAQVESHYLRALISAATELETLLILPLENLVEDRASSPALVPRVNEANVGSLDQLEYEPRLVELEKEDDSMRQRIQDLYPETIVGVCVGSEAQVPELAEAGYSLIHLVGNNGGRLGEQHMLQAIQRAHQSLLESGTREAVTLLGSGGIFAAEHVPKAIIAGLDAVILDTPLLLAVQARVANAKPGGTELPAFEPDWGRQRLVNLVASWRDQLLEILGAMGMREVRRLRGEVGRAMFVADLEQEAFTGIEGYPDGRS